MTVTDLHNSIFMQSLGKLASEIIQATIPKEGGGKASYTLSRDLRPDEEYVQQSLIAASELINVCEQLNFAVEFLSGYRSKSTLASMKLTRLDYIVYHLENHLIRTGMLFDRALQFVNVIFCLGLPERECRFSTIADNHHVLATPVGTAIKELDNMLKPYRAQRNVVVHRRGYIDQALEPIEVFYVLQKSDDDLIDNYFFLMKHMTDKVVAAKRAELNQFNEHAFSKIDQLLLASHKVFVSKHATLCAA